MFVVLAAALMAPAAALDTGAMAQVPSDRQPSIKDPRWIKLPNGADYQRYWPRAAWREEIEGAVLLDCDIDEAGHLLCRVVAEDPPGMDFGEAAIRLSREFRMAPTTMSGMATAGGRYLLRISFRFGF